MRVTDNFGSSSFQQTTTDFMGGITKQVKIDPNAKLGNYKQADSLPVPRTPYHEGVLKLTPFNVSTTESSATSSTVSIPKYGTYGVKVDLVGQLAAYNITRASDGLELTGYVPDLALEDKIKGLAMTKARCKMVAPANDLGMFFAELRETLHMLRNPVKSLSGLLNAMVKDAEMRTKGGLFVTKRGRKAPRVKNLRAITDALSDVWLQYRYGVRPLMMDIEMIRNLHENGIAKRRKALVRRKASESRTRHWSLEYYGSVVGTCLFKHTFTETITATACEYMYDKTYNTPYDGLPTLSNVGLSVMQIPSMLWELTPYSFCVDWVTNMGDWIRSLEPPPPNLQPAGRCVSMVKTISSDRMILKWLSSDPNWVGTCDARYYQQTRAFSRTIGGSIPAWPVFDVDLSMFNRRVDALSLIWQKMPKKWRF